MKPTLCSRCKKNLAVIFITKIDGGKTVNEGLCLKCAKAPASTMMTIRQTGAKGDFVDTLLQVVALDDVVGLVL